MKILFKKYADYKDRRLRERCVRYAISQPPTASKDVHELAILFYSYIKYGSDCAIVEHTELNKLDHGIACIVSQSS